MLLADPDQPGLTPRERLAIRVRNGATTTGRCACGATIDLAAVAAGKVNVLSMVHEDDCPGGSQVVERAGRRLGARLAYREYVVEIEVAA